MKFNTKLFVALMLILSTCIHAADPAQRANQLNHQLFQATTNNDAERIRQLAADGANLEVQNLHTDTPLRYAAQKGLDQAVQALIAAGADVNAKSPDGTYNVTALHLAAANGHTGCLQALIFGGANINAANRKKYTALMLAAEKGHLECVRALLMAGANPDLKTGKKTAADLAREDYPEIADFITQFFKEKVQKRFREVARTLLLTQKRLQKTDPEHPMARMPKELIIEEAKATVRAEYGNIPNEWFIEVLNSKTNQAGPAGV